MNHQWLVSGVGRSGTSSVYKTLLEVALKQDSEFAFYYEPYLWGEKIWSRRPKSWKVDFGVTSALNPVGLCAHLHTPLFFDDASHSAHDNFSDGMFGAEQNALAKVIRGAGRLNYYLKRYPGLRVIHVIRNPLDCVNSALGLFSFFGDEFHISDQFRFFKAHPKHDPSNLTEAQLFALWWREMNEVSLRAARENPTRVFIFPHELYVADPKSAYGALLEFLDIPEEHLQDISFSDPAGPITTTINLGAQDVTSMLDIHHEYFDRLPTISSIKLDVDKNSLQTRTQDKYSVATDGAFSPVIPRNISALVLRRRFTAALKKHDGQLKKKNAQIARLQKKIEEKRNLHRRMVKKAKADILNRDIRFQKMEGEFRLLQENYSSIETEKIDLSTQLKELQYVLAPRLKTLLTLRPLRYVLQQRKKRITEQRNSQSSDINKVDCAQSEKTTSQPPLPPNEAMSHVQSIYASHTISKPLGIALFAYDRFEHVEHVLKSLEQQGALKDTTVWIDGDQGNTAKKLQIDNVEHLVKSFPVKAVHRNRSNFGFRKMILIAMREMMHKYERILFLEDDCFPTRHALKGFSFELDSIEQNEKVFSVYGHPFLIQNESEGHGRFQGWGWATTKKKLTPIWERLLECYMMSEDAYIEFAKKALNDDLRSRIDVTPGRQPTDTLTKFFAWDETLCLLAAMKGMIHKPTSERLIFNFGAGDQSTHFGSIDYYRNPPFNMISPSEVWRHF